MDGILSLLGRDMNLLVHAGIIAFLTLLANFFINRAISAAIKRKTKNEGFDITNLKFLQRALSVLIILIGLSFIIFSIPSLKHIAQTLLAGAGVIVAVIGFASQQVLSNTISGIMIIFTKPYRLNDRISVRNLDGVVEDITLRHTVIKNYENKRIIVPNSVMNSELIINSNFAEDICCEWVEFGISFTADVQKAKTLMQQEVINHPLFVDYRSTDQKKKGADIAPVRVIDIGEYSILLRAWTWAKDPGDAFLLGCDLKESIKSRFQKEGIEIPYPYHNIYQK